MSTKYGNERNRDHRSYNSQRPHQNNDADYSSSVRDPKDKGKAVASPQRSRRPQVNPKPQSPREEFLLHYRCGDELYDSLMDDIMEHLKPKQGYDSSRTFDRLQDATPRSLPCPDTSMYETIAKLSPNPRMYMITSNLKRNTTAEVHYWATLGDLMYKNASGRPVAYKSTDEVLRRIYYELHIQNSKDDKIVSTFTLFAQFGLHPTATLHPVDRHGQSISNAIQHYDAFLKSTDIPAYKRVLRLHLEFSSRPDGYASAQPSRRITDYYLKLIKDPIVLYDDGTLVPLKDDPKPSRLHALEQTQSLKKRRSSAQTTLSDFIPSSHRSQTIERVASGVPENKVPLRQFGKNLIPEGLLRLDGMFSDKQPSVLAQLGPRMGVAGVYNLDEGLLDTPSPNVDEWRACCSLLPDLSPYELSKDIRARSIPILRSTLRITPPQLYSAVEMLRRPAGFLAHDMGLGKTHTVLAAVALRVLILNSKRMCEQAWSSGSKGQHLGRSTRPQQGQHCPSQSKRPGDVLCYCVPGGLTREIGRRTRGVSLLQVPTNARTEWINAIAQAKFSKASYDFVVVSQSSDVPADLKRPREFYNVFGSTCKLNPTVKPNNQTPPQHLEAADFDWEIGAKFGYLESFVFVISHTDATWFDMFKLSINGLPNQIYAAPVGLSFIDEAHNPNLWASGSSSSHTYTMAR